MEQRRAPFRLTAAARRKSTTDLTSKVKSIKYLIWGLVSGSHVAQGGLKGSPCYVAEDNLES